MTIAQKIVAAPAASPFGVAELEPVIARIAARAEAPGRRAEDVRADVESLRSAGFGTFRLPASEGGAGAKIPDLIGVVIALAEVDSNLPHVLRNHFLFVEKAQRSKASPKFARWLDEVRAGRLFGLGASETGIQNIGAGGGNTVVRPEGSGFVLDGVKYYSTGNAFADYIYVNARTPEGVPVAAVVPRKREGVSVLDDWDGIGQELTASGTTTFSGVKLSAHEVIVQAEEEAPVPHDATLAQLYLTSIVTGILKAVARDAAGLIRSRGRNFYHATAARPAEDPQLQEALGRIASAAYVAEAAVLRAAEALDGAIETARAGAPDAALFEEAARRAAQSKVVLDGLALDAASRLFDVGGASAATRRAGLDRHWRNIRTLASHNPVAYKARALGRQLLDGTPLPAAAFF
ncbi:alkylation response protein AidB-like acyl-CoA dehydrogenase [Xanthobacter flavus]|uniref:Acyl-CoA dehydrogenase n=1 Tax=Xanthobacter flavus TaxID=281 RepID=A0A9W6CS01_XANFL|nr:acyl-CoA dehydrogenase [Xanthobacter flavus]MDR6336437.1 alkylation response protein AidB-like acyl-CoA dehydrogenase [Xanthobacter flavus]GLI25212.1 putative acyl-CoA dehydrogenase [Xanthobacter flavus]